MNYNTKCTTQKVNSKTKINLNKLKRRESSKFNQSKALKKFNLCHK